MKKAFDQTVRDLKRGVNKKVLKVPSIEQKVLDATSNEPWGPHGSVLADIAQATRNYHEYRMIMAVIWKRINDTGKNWRHVYKALTVLDYLVAHGSERVIDDIREHAYQISTLSDFQYIDSSGRDQGNNVRKKSQSLVILVNDKERLQEVRQKAAANRDKYRNTTMGRPGSGSYGDRFEDDRYEGRYGNRDDDRNGYGRERDWGSRDNDRGRYGDSYGREGDRYGRNYEDRSSRDGYRDDDYRGRSQSVDDYHYGSRSRSSEGDRYRANEDDGQYSSRGSGARADENSQDGSSMGNRRHSEQSLGAPPSYEEAVSAGRSPIYSEREGESSVGYAPRASSPTGASPSHATTAAAATTGPASPPVPVSPSASTSFQPKTHDNNNQDDDGFDEFDPRGAFSASSNASNVPPAATAGVEMDLLGSLSESFSSNALALVPTQPDTTTEAHAPANSDSGPTFAAGSSSSAINDQQPFDDPFGDGPFQAISSGYTLTVQQEIPQSINSFNNNSSMQSLDAPQNDTTPFGVGPADAQPPTNSHQFVQHELSTGNQDIDILADILPPSSFVNPQTGYNLPPQPMSHGGFPLQTNQPSSQFGLPAQTVQNAPQNMQPETTNPPGFGFPTQHGQPQLQASYPLQTAESVPQTGFTGQTMAFTVPVQAGQASQLGYHAQGGPIQMSQPNSNYYGNVHAQSAPMGPPGAAYNTMAPTSAGQFSQENFLSKPGFVTQMPPQTGPQGQPSNLMSTTVSTTPASTGPLASVSQPPKEKFEMKSSVWADTLSRGLVNLNISGSKTNPLADIGVDFDAINRKEKRMEKPSTTTTPVMSTVTMGKAMGSGTGLGRAGATSLRPPHNAIMGSGNMGMGVGPMGGYGVGQPMGMGMNMIGNMGMGMRPNMGIGQGLHMQQQQGFPPGSNMPGNPNYGQQPYGGGYR